MIGKYAFYPLIKGMANVPKPVLISFDMKGAILSGNNLIYMSGMAKRESQFSIKFVQLESEGLFKEKNIILIFKSRCPFKIGWRDSGKYRQ